MTQLSEVVLVVERGVNEVSVIPLDKSPHVLGKLPPADTIFENPYVSRRHAEIRRVDDRYQIQDLDSKNGTFVNGTPMRKAPQWLHNGDRIDLGLNQVVLRFRSWDSTLTVPPPPEGTPAASLVVDSRSREVYIGGPLLEPPLSRKEFDVLLLLYQRRGEARSKDDLAARGWPDRSEGDVGDQEIEQCIRRLRLRVEPDPSSPKYIQTVRGYGYKLAKE